jgi:hypothetical protein
MLVVKQTERKSANHQVTTPCVKPDCMEKNLRFDQVNSALPVPIDHPSIPTSDTALPSDELFEPPSASERELRTHAIQVGDGDEENGFGTATSATKEPVEISIDSDYLETREDGDLGTVVLADKGKGVDPQEYGGALYDPKAMIAPAGTASIEGSDFIELVGIHQDKGKNVDPEERGNEMAEDEAGPSQIDFHDDSDDELLDMFFQEQVILLESFERTRTTDLNDGLHHDPTLPRLSWRPKISPYRFMVFSIPLAIGTVKAVLSYRGYVTTPITLEWICGVLIFLM